MLSIVVLASVRSAAATATATTAAATASARSTATASAWSATVPPAPGVSTATEWIGATASLRHFWRSVSGCRLRQSLRLVSRARSRTLAGPCGCLVLQARDLLGHVREPLHGLGLCSVHALHELTGCLCLPGADVDVHGGEALVQLLALGLQFGSLAATRQSLAG